MYLEFISVSQVFAGAKPLLDKTLGVLVEGLIDTLLSIFHENESKEFKSLDANGFCQLMLEVCVSAPTVSSIVPFVSSCN